MTKNNICSEINTLASIYLGHTVRVAKISWSKDKLNKQLASFREMVEHFEAAQLIRGKYSDIEWNAMVLFPASKSAENTVTEWSEHMRRANDLWLGCSN